MIENVAFPLELQGLGEKERRTKAQQVIDLVGLAGRENSFPRELSGGQQQRVGIARSLAVEPELWFLDEPFSALDPLIRRQMQDEFLRLQKDLHKSIVFITHDFMEALRIADRMAIMRDGEVVQIGKPADLVLNPADDYVREFTNDVPWEMILTAGDIVDPLKRPRRSMKRVNETDTLSEVIKNLRHEELGVAVKGSDGKIIGSIDPDAIVRAMVGISTRDHSVETM